MHSKFNTKDLEIFSKFSENQKLQIFQKINFPKFQKIQNFQISEDAKFRWFENYRTETLKMSKKVPGVGFEPTHLTIIELKSTALDRSAIQALDICLKFPKK